MAEVDCHNCGDTVEKPPGKIERNERHFCSRECYHNSGRPDMQGENNPNPETGKVTVECEHCGDSFEVYPYREDSARFCSRECKDSNMAGETGEQSRRWEGAKETFECVECGSEFKRFDKQNDNKYCSKDCYNTASSRMFSGDGNPAWRGGYDGYYGPNWDGQRRKAIERDQRTCQRCGKHAEDMHRSPDVHHKKRLGWFKEEYDAPEWYEKANRLENLVTLCQRCHAKIEWSENGEISG
jgi:5-methylcytosine-specific restriction endonuclease McrA